VWGDVDPHGGGLGALDFGAGDFAGSLMIDGYCILPHNQTEKSSLSTPGGPPGGTFLNFEIQ
jgi:hypothetical protein